MLPGRFQFVPVIGQTLAILLDSYRELNAKKLFWVVLGLSGLCVVIFAGVGINEEGISIFVFDIPSDVLNTSVLPSRAYFYKVMFFSLGFQIWLTWVATILALISTCAIIPDFLAGGAIELTLSKPIGRVRLLLTKIAGAMLFVFLQVAIFTVASFLVIGIRGGEWVWSLFLAIPLVLLFFSYLYCVYAVIGVFTRSAIAALLLTLLVWFSVFVIHASETIFLQVEETHHQAVLVLQGEINADERALEQPASDAERADIREDLEDRRSRLGEAHKDLALWNRVHAVGFAVKTILPKTTETMDLLGRVILGSEGVAQQMDQTSEGLGPMASQVNGVRVSQSVVAREVAKRMRSRSILWIIGTSVLFEACVLAIGCIRFVRRDY